jgi:hypothetical protein
VRLLFSSSCVPPFCELDSANHITTASPLQPIAPLRPSPQQSGQDLVMDVAELIWEPITE